MLRQLIKKIPKYFLKLLIFSLPVISQSIYANKDVTIFSNNFTFDIRMNLGIYSGNVVVSDDTKELFAETIKVFRSKNNKVTKIIATGNPARFFDKTKTDSFSSGHAKNITYLKTKNLVILEKNATLNNKENSLKAPKILYNTKTQIAKTLNIDSQNNSGRTKIVLSNIKD